MSLSVVDFHCHLDLYENPALAARRAHELGAYILSVTTTPSAWAGTNALAQGYGRIRTSLGLHPQVAGSRIAELEIFDEFIHETRYVGEVGLDGSPSCQNSWAKQLLAFRHILKASASAGGRILTIHSRHATTAVLDELDLYPDAGIPILHWFTGTKSELMRAIGRGCWFSVGPAMLASAKGRAMASLMPSDRVLTETDGPFGKLDKQGLAPGEVFQAIHYLAKCWGVDCDTATRMMLQTLRRLTTSAL